MRVKWYGTATLLIESGFSSVLVDPYCHDFNQELLPLPIEEFKNVDAMLITHPHFDHFIDIDRVTEVVNRVPVYVGKRGLEIASKCGFSMKQMREINVGDHIQIGELSVKVHQGKHCVFDFGLILDRINSALRKGKIKEAIRLWILNCKFHIGKKDIFTFEIDAEGKKLVLMGSANIDKKAINPHHMDVLIYPYQGRSDMLTYSIPVLEYLQPKQVVLDHFDDAFPPLTCEMDCEKLVSFTESNCAEYSVYIPKCREWIEI